MFPRKGRQEGGGGAGDAPGYEMFNSPGEDVPNAATSKFLTAVLAVIVLALATSVPIVFGTATP